MTINKANVQDELWRDALVVRDEADNLWARRKSTVRNGHDWFLIGSAGTYSTGFHDPSAVIDKDGNNVELDAANERVETLTDQLRQMEHVRDDAEARAASAGRRSGREATSEINKEYWKFRAKLAERERDEARRQIEDARENAANADRGREMALEDHDIAIDQLDRIRNILDGDDD